MASITAVCEKGRCWTESSTAHDKCLEQACNASQSGSRANRGWNIRWRMVWGGGYWKGRLLGMSEEPVVIETSRWEPPRVISGSSRACRTYENISMCQTSLISCLWPFANPANVWCSMIEPRHRYTAVGVSTGASLPGIAAIQASILCCRWLVSLPECVLAEGTRGRHPSAVTDGCLFWGMVKSEEVGLKLIGQRSPPLPRRFIELVLPHFALPKTTTRLACS